MKRAISKTAAAACEAMVPPERKAGLSGNAILPEAVNAILPPFVGGLSKGNGDSYSMRMPQDESSKRALIKRV